MSEQQTNIPVPPVEQENATQSREIMARMSDAAQVAIYGVSRWNTERRLGNIPSAIEDAHKDMEQAGETMERMDHKQALYGYVGEVALTGQSDIEDRNGVLSRNETPQPRTRAERRRARHIADDIIDASWDKDLSGARRKATLSPYAGAERSQTHTRILGRHRQGSTRGVNQKHRSGELYAEMNDYKAQLMAEAAEIQDKADNTTGVITRDRLEKQAEKLRQRALTLNPSSWRATQEAAAKVVRKKTENPEQARTRDDLHEKNLRLAAAQRPRGEGWRNMRRSRAIGNIKTNYYEATDKLPAKQQELDEKQRQIQEKQDELQERRDERNSRGKLPFFNKFRGNLRELRTEDIQGQVSRLNIEASFHEQGNDASNQPTDKDMSKKAAAKRVKAVKLQGKLVGRTPIQTHQGEVTPYIPSTNKSRALKQLEKEQREFDEAARQA